MGINKPTFRYQILVTIILMTSWVAKSNECLSPSCLHIDQAQSKVEVKQNEEEEMEEWDDEDPFIVTKEVICPVESEMPTPAPNDDLNRVYDEVEQPAFFPGGEQALYKWLNNYMSYPVKALEQGIQGTVWLQFIVEKDGSISNVKVSKGVDPLLDNEALRVMRRMPKWEPGKDNGQPVRSYISMPLGFWLK